MVETALVTILQCFNIHFQVTLKYDIFRLRTFYDNYA